MARRTRKPTPPRVASEKKPVPPPAASKRNPALVIPSLQLDAAPTYWPDLSKLFNCDTLSDIDIHVGPGPCIFHAHQNILWTHTSFFSDAVNSGFAESKSHVVTLQDEPMVVWAFLKWCYEGDVAGEVPGEYESNPPLDAATLFLRLYFLAGMLMVQKLKMFCVQKLEKLITFDGSACSIDFAAIIPEALEITTDNEDPLRVMLTQKAVEGYTTLVTDKRYHAMLKEYPEFMETILVGLRFHLSDLAEMDKAVREFFQNHKSDAYWLQILLGKRQITRLNLES